MKKNGISEKILVFAADFLKEWENGDTTLDSALDELRRDDFNEKAAVASLLFEYFRHKGFIDGLITTHAKKPGMKQDLRLLLCCALTQTLYQSGIAAQSAVNIAVDHAKQRFGQGSGGFVNAMLRSILRDPMTEQHKNVPSFPPLLQKRWKKQFGVEKTVELTAHFAGNPPLTFRARRPLTQEESATLEASEIPMPNSMNHFRFYQTSHVKSVITSPLLENATIYIQDPATALAFSLLKNPPEGDALDACAAPGGKTIMLHDLAVPGQLRITAVDRSAKRLEPMRQNLRRAGVDCRILQADAQELPFKPKSFDLILADLPCSNSGVIRRRPDAPWRFSEKKLKELLILQQKILSSLAPLLKSGGQLLYSTCSIEEEEDHCQVQTFLAGNDHFELVEQRLLTPSLLHDGAFAALLKKRSE